ncbi:MAG: HEAT repeat domain-containing protein [Planctomycetota bacterium]|nr:HEAT repeat domain-containing protein [Planctomycetota bacterium]
MNHLHLPRIGLAATLLLLCAVGTGCGFINGSPRWAKLFSADNDPLPADSSPAADKAAAKAQADPQLAKATSSHLLDTSAALADPNWVTIVSPESTSTSEESPFTLRHFGLDSVLAREDAQQILKAALKSPSEVTRVNAAIGLGHIKQSSAVPRLVEIVRGEQLKLTTRQAAVESLSAMQSPTAASAISQLTSHYGAYQGAARQRYVPALHASLLRAAAQAGVADLQKHAVAGLHSPAVEARLAAVNACQKLDPKLLPSDIFVYAADVDPRVRSAALRLLTAATHEQAQECSERGLKDIDLTVRTTAIECLGKLGGPANQKSLTALLSDSSELIRATAITQLASYQDLALLDPVLADKSWRVRAAAAEALATLPPEKARPLGEKLLRDPSSEVQKRVISAVTNWPMEQAGPLLLTALEKRSPLLRRAAAEQFQDRWPEVADETARIIAGQQVDIAALTQRWQAAFSKQSLVTVTAEQPEFAANENAPASGHNLVELAELVRQFQQSAPGEYTWNEQYARLSVWPELCKDLEQLYGGHAVEIPAAILEQVLPRQDQRFAALERIRSGSESEGRIAMASLLELAEAEPLPRFGLRRLAEILEKQPDAELWELSLKMIASAASPDALRIATAAASHPTAEVRRRACVYLGEHPSQRAGEVLLRTLKDDNAAVVEAAVVALGSQSLISDYKPLEQLLLSPALPLRVRVAASLSRLGAESGMKALARLSNDTSPGVRLQSAIAMGEVASTMATLPGTDAWTAELIRLLDDPRADVRRAALHSLPSVAGSAAPDAEATAEQWKEWYSQQRNL